MELDAVRAWSRYPDVRRMRDGWQLVGFRHDGGNGWESLLPDLMEETGHSVVGAFVLDSDGATWLEIESVMCHLVIPPVEVDKNDVTTVDENDPDYLRERVEMRAWLDALGDPAAKAAPLAVAWAREAGLDADVAPVEAVMSRTGGFVEEVYFDLLTTLGLPWRD